MKTNNVPLKIPIKLPPEMQKKFWIFQNFLVFRAFFEKTVVLENGQIWNQSIFLNETFRRASSLRFIKNGCIVDERCPHLMPHTYLRSLLANEKFAEKMPLVTFLHWYVDNLNPENEKNLMSSFGEKPILRFLLT